MLFKKSKRNPEVYLAETHQYVKDLQEITTLRSYSAPNSDERKRYSRMIECMQEVLIFMNTVPADQKKALADATFPVKTAVVDTPES